MSKKLLTICSHFRLIELNFQQASHIQRTPDERMRWREL